MVEIGKEKAIKLAPGKDLKDPKDRSKIPLSELTKEQLQYKRKIVYDQLAEMEESIHYAKQDLAAFFSSLNIQNPEKRIEAQRVVDDMTRDFEMLRRELSEIQSYL
jgi:hypothetical protein